MTRKDYILIADMVISTIRTGFMHDPEDYIDHISAFLASRNTNFDSNKFRKYIEKNQ